jgi:hypothetical protein
MGQLAYLGQPNSFLASQNDPTALAIPWHPRRSCSPRGASSGVRWVSSMNGSEISEGSDGSDNSEGICFIFVDPPTSSSASVFNVQADRGSLRLAMHSQPAVYIQSACSALGRVRVLLCCVALFCTFCCAAYTIQLYSSARYAIAYAVCMMIATRARGLEIHPVSLKNDTCRGASWWHVTGPANNRSGAPAAR